MRCYNVHTSLSSYNVGRLNQLESQEMKVLSFDDVYDDEYRRITQSPEPVRSGSFTYGKDGFAVGGISREPLSELKTKNTERIKMHKLIILN